MSLELLYQLLPFIIMILVGLLIALLWLLWVTARQEKAPKDEMKPPDGPEPASVIADEAVEGSAARTTLSPPPDVGASPGEEHQVVEAMRVLRDGNGALVVELDGRRYRSPAEIGDPALHSRVLRDAQALAAFAGLPELPPPPAPPPLADDVAPREPASELPSGPGYTLDTLLPPVPGGMAPPVGSPSRSAADGLTEEVDSRPFVDQIEELLQYRLMLAPEFAGRSIHIRPAPDGGVRILVDGQTYENVDEVEDTGVRQFLQETIREWEARQ